MASTRNGAQGLPLVRPAGPAVSPAVGYGLVLAWAVHDLEEVLTYGAWRRAAIPRLRARLPRVPERVWRAIESTDERQFALAVAIVGVSMAVAAGAGQRSGGRSEYFQSVLAGFGLHAVGHVTASIGARGYTPGLVSAPVVAVPYTIWATRRLKAAGVWRPASASHVASAIALAVAVLGGSHVLARGLSRLANRRARS